MEVFMNKKNIIYIFIILTILISLGFYFYFKNANSYNSQYQADKTSTSNNESNKNENNLNSANNNSHNNDTSNNNSSNNSSNNDSNNSPKNAESKETEISTFSTTLYSKDSERQNNIQITCSALSGTVVKSGEIFSFCSTVGPATKGYQKADIFDNKGNKKKGYGGGNCQISSTLYNAVMAVPNLEIIERHPHSNKVPYVKKDKDAAVAYGSYDFKFKNNTGNDIRILASVDSSCVTTSIWTISK